LTLSAATLTVATTPVGTITTELPERYGVPTVDRLLEVGRRRVVGGQEDLVVDVALDLLRDKEGSA
jgi:hypothetical protein